MGVPWQVVLAILGVVAGIFLAVCSALGGFDRE